MGTAGATGECPIGTQELAKVGRAVGTVEAKGNAVGKREVEELGTVPGATLSCEVEL